MLAKTEPTEPNVVNGINVDDAQSGAATRYAGARLALASKRRVLRRGANKRNDRW